MKKLYLIIAFALIVCGTLLLPGQAAWAADKEVTLNLEDIAVRVAGYNSTVRIGKIALTETQSALRLANEANRDRREQRASVSAAIDETKDLIDLITSGDPDYIDTDLKEAQSTLSMLEQVYNSLGNQSTSQLERTIEAVALQNAQSLGQLVNSAQQLFIRIHQLKLNITLQQSRLEQAKTAVSKAEVRLTHGLGTAAALAEAKLQLHSTQTELTAMENQLQTQLAQMRTYTGYTRGEVLVLGAVPELEFDFLAKIDLEQDAEAAVTANYSLKLLGIDRINASSTSAKRKIDIQIEQQKIAVRQGIKQKYDTLLETQAKLDLAAAELAQTKQQLMSAEANYKLGRIAKNTLEKQQANLEARQTAWQNATLALVLEIGDYQAKVGGLN